MGNRSLSKDLIVDHLETLYDTVGFYMVKGTTLNLIYS